MTPELQNQLAENRDAIDAIDSQLVNYLNARVEQDGGLSEEAVIANIVGMNPGPLTDASLEAIYRAFMLEGQVPHAKTVDETVVVELDKVIVDRLNRRVRHASAIGVIKHANGADYYDPTREAQVMEKIEGLNKGPVSNRRLRRVYREIISSSISLEKQLKIAYLGPEATYTHQAAIANFGVSLSYLSQKTIGDVFTQVVQGKADYGVVPIENSTEGVVFHSMDMLVESDLQICAQIYLPIEHCLISQSSIAEIKEVRSKDQALGQCREWLHTHVRGAALVDVVSTGSAVKAASEDPKIAAVASELAARTYGVPILKKGIQDRDDNVTRFLVVGKTKARPLLNGRDKTSLVFTLADECGALEKALHCFAARRINLCKIESRPSRKKAWDYFFFIDLEGHYEEPQVRLAIDELSKYCSFVKWLGSYPNDTPR